MRNHDVLILKHILMQTFVSGENGVGMMMEAVRK
jgi:hypothetical protein